MLKEKILYNTCWVCDNCGEETGIEVEIKEGKPTHLIPEGWKQVTFPPKSGFGSGDKKQELCKECWEYVVSALITAKCEVSTKKQ